MIALLSDAVRDETSARFDAMRAKQRTAGEGVDAARAYVEAMLGLQVWAHKLYGAVHAPTHEGAGDEHY